MKTYLRLLILAVLACAVSCRKPASITLSQNEIKASSSSQSVSIVVTSNYAWSVTSTESWVSLSSTSKSDGGSSNVIVSLLPNTTPDSRSATLTFVCEDATAILTITQDQKDMVVLEGESSFSANWENQQIEVKLNKNTSYTATPSADWIQVVETKGLVPGSVVLSISENPLYQERKATVVFYVNDGKTLASTLTIIQTPRPRILSLAHTNDEFMVPKIIGKDLNGTIDWGDGQTEEYKVGASHSYKTSETHEVEISAVGANAFTIDNIIGVDFLDLSKF